MAALRRYPVKSMGGEPLPSIELDRRGLSRDRWYAVEDEDGRFASGKSTTRFRRRDAVFGYSAGVEGGRVVVRGAAGTWRVGDPALDEELSRAMGARVRVSAEAAVPHQDAGQVSIVGTASLDWCSHYLGVDADPRRLRPNILVRTSLPFVEETWTGMSLHVGGAVLHVVERIERCRMVDLAQDGMSSATPLLAALAGERDLRLGVYASVETPGRIAVGDEIVVRRLADGRLDGRLDGPSPSVGV